MKRFKNILMVFNGNPNHQAALMKVASLAKIGGARLTLVDVIDESFSAARILERFLDTSKFKNMLTQDRKNAMQQAIGLIGGDPSAIETKVLYGNPPIAIIREVIENKHDLVVKSAVGPDTGLGGKLFGSTAIKLMRKCPVPVWVLKPSQPVRFRRILAAVSPKEASNGDDRLNELILSLAQSIARSENGHLDVLHCWRVPGESMLSGGRTRMDPEAFDRISADADVAAKRSLDALLQPFGLTEGENVGIHRQRGHVALLLPAFIESHNVDLVVMGTLARAGVAGLISGNTAEKIFHSADCSVLALKPPGFVSPVVQ
jgi:universal stress protein E